MKSFDLMVVFWKMKTKMVWKAPMPKNVDFSPEGYISKTHCYTKRS